MMSAKTQIRVATFLCSIAAVTQVMAGSPSMMDSKASGMIKLRRDDPFPPTVTAVTLEAAQNEFEGFQIVVPGPVSNLSVFATALVNTVTGDKISAATCDSLGNSTTGNIRVYREAFMQIGSATGTGVPTTNVPPPLSDAIGIGGMVPDALIPQVDEFYNECRWPLAGLSIGANQNLILWVDILVPPSAPAGHYQGSVVLAWSGNTTCDNSYALNVDLKVWKFPVFASNGSPASAKGHLPVFFNSSSYSGLSQQHCGGPGLCPNGTLTGLVQRYAAMGLDHHIGMTNYDDGNPDLAAYLTNFGPLNRGQSLLTRIGNAAPYRVSYLGNLDSSVAYSNWYNALFGQSWLTSMFSFIVDEPSAIRSQRGFRYCDIHPRAVAAHSAATDAGIPLPTLVTQDIANLNAQAPIGGGASCASTPFDLQPTTSNPSADVNIMVPVIDSLDKTTGVNTRHDYDAFLNYQTGPNASSINALWSYESCDTHGCGSFLVNPTAAGQIPSGTPCYDGSTFCHSPLWPSIGAIDHSLVRARAMPWLAFKNSLMGILYYDTLNAFVSYTEPSIFDNNGHVVGGGGQGGHPWQQQYLAGGNGDGTLFYPGTPAAISAVLGGGGGRSDIPLASLRLKMIREGLEDYEYMALLGSLRTTWIKAQIASVFPTAWQTELANANLSAKLFAVRHALGCQYQADRGYTNDPDCAQTPPAQCMVPNPDNCNGLCTNVLTDSNHCGSCNAQHCASGLCTNGGCVTSCNPGYVACCDGACYRGSTCPPCPGVEVRAGPGRV